MGTSLALLLFYLVALLAGIYGFVQLMKVLPETTAQVGERRNRGAGLLRAWCTPVPYSEAARRRPRVGVPLTFLMVL